LSKKLKNKAEDRSGASTPKQHRGLAPPWRSGQSGNPAGRRKGSRNQLGEDFLRDLYNAWTEHGPAALKAAAQEKPAEFCKMVASLLPKKINLKNELSEFTDEQLAALDALATSLLGDAAGNQEEDSSRAGEATKH
jgi:Family of unknown function (DUF5681)